MKKSTGWYIVQLCFMGALGAFLAFGGIKVSEDPGTFFLILGTVLAYGMAVRLEEICRFLETIEKLKGANQEMLGHVKSLKETLRGKDDP